MKAIFKKIFSMLITNIIVIPLIFVAISISAYSGSSPMSGTVTDMSEAEPFGLSFFSIVYFELSETDTMFIVPAFLLRKEVLKIEIGNYISFKATPNGIVPDIE